MSDAYTFVKRRRGLSPSARLVLITIAEYCDENGEWSPSVKRIAGDIEMTERTVVKALDELTTKKAIERERQSSKIGRRAPDRIRLLGFVEFVTTLNGMTDKEKSPDENSSREEFSKVKNNHVNGLHVEPDVGAQTETNTKSSGEEFSLDGGAARPKARSAKKKGPRTPKEKTTSPSQSSGDVGAATKPKPHSMPEDWAPAQSTRLYADSIGFHGWEIEAAVVECREYWLDRPSEKRAGWDNTFKRRLRDLRDDPKMRSKLKFVRPKASGPDDGEWRRRLANYEHDGTWGSDWGPRPGKEGYAGPPLKANGHANGAHP